MLVGQDIVSTFSGLKEMMDDVLEIMTKMKQEAASPPPVFSREGTGKLFT